MAREPIDRYYNVALTGDFLTGSLTIPVASIPTIPAGEPVYLTLEDVPGAPTKHEVVLAESSAAGDITVASGGRGQLGTTEQDWGDTDKISGYLWTADIKNRVRREGDDFTALGISSEYYDNGASGTFDRANGEAQECTLTAAATAITVTGLSATKQYMLLEIYDADTYAPDITAITPLINEATITYGAMTRILAEYCADGTTRFTFLGYSAT